MKYLALLLVSVSCFCQGVVGVGVFGGAVTGPGGGGSVFTGSSGVSNTCTGSVTFSLADVSGTKSPTVITCLLSGNTTIHFSNPTPGAHFSLSMIEPGGSTWTVSWTEAVNTCDQTLAVNITTTYVFEVQPDGTTIKNLSCSDDSVGVKVSGPEMAPITTTIAGHGVDTFGNGSHTREYFSNNSASRHIMPKCAGSTDQCASADLSDAVGVKRKGIPFSIGDPAGSALTAAATTTDYFTVPVACNISAINLVIDAGTITVKLWKIATGTAIPTSANLINTSTGFSISSGTAIHITALGDLTTTTISANDILAMNVTAVATAKYVQGVLQCDLP